MKINFNITMVLLTFLTVFSASEVQKQPQVPRCLCPQVHPGRIPYKLVKNVLLYSPRPHCSKTEVIIQLKDGHKICLDPNNHSAKMMLERLSKRIQKSQSKEDGDTILAPTLTTTWKQFKKL
ncbi:hypothetical protein UPYG_G00237720 [Umbra pygmaea]|uniref:Chemokine interleukin-8-like domain-containing protein n=1 Tax=Umbra pygmaea TaxID=75934 RepID=A0ABD0WET4_UMBPY